MALRNFFILFLSVFSLCGLSSTIRLTNIPDIHGHRGSRGTHPENTLPAFREAVSSHIQVLEMDLHLTKDDVLVLSHDAKISPALCLDAKGKKVTSDIFIRNLTLKEVKQYDCGALANPKFPEQVPVPGTTIPTFDEILDWVVQAAPGYLLNIETKMDAGALNPDPRHFVTLITLALKKHGLLNRAILQSFDPSTLIAAKKINPSLALSFLTKEGTTFCSQAKQLGAKYASPEFSLLTKEIVRECHLNKIRVAPWTVNETADWAKVIAMGVDAIITDYPRKLAAYLAQGK